jgi:YegS/Rv2252/BmrU family lipid kinase
VSDAWRPERRRVLLVVNPASRRGMKVLARAKAAFAAAGVQCDEHCTTEPGAGARAAAERHGDYDAVFTLGGDGTAMEVVDALAGTGCPVGILAGGTGNLIARTLGVPIDVRRAVPALLGGDVAEIDLGVLTVDGVRRRFAFAAGAGIDAAMIERAPARLKRRLGVLAYVVSAARAVFAREEFDVRATVDGVTHERRASSVMVANFGAVLDDLITLGPGIQADDGLLDLCVFSPRGLLDAVRLLWRLARRDFRPSESLLYLPGRTMRVEITPARRVQADGELLGSGTFEVTVEPRAARLLVPAARRTIAPAGSASRPLAAPVH